MYGVQGLVVIICLVYAVKAQTYTWDFDCRTAGPNACGTGNTCDTATGSCTCANSNTNYDCTTASSDSTGCTTPCIAATTTACESDVCICNQGYFLGTSSDCSEKRAKITCDADGADIELNTYAGTDFGGIAYLLNPTDDAKIPTCALTCTAGVCTATAATRLLYAGGAGPHADCPVIAPTTDTTTMVNTHTFKVYVQYSTSTPGVLDRIFTVTCESGGTDPTFEATVIAGTSSSGAATAVGTVTGDLDTGVTLTLTAGGSAIVTGTAITSGDPLTLTASAEIGLIAAAGTHIDMSIKEVIAYNYDVGNIATAPSGALSLILIEDWCVTNAGRQFVTSFTKPTAYDDTSTFDMMVVFTAFTFATTSDGTALVAASGDSSAVWLKVGICPGDCNSLQTLVDCPYDYTTYPDQLAVPTGRKRRQVTESGPSETVDLLLNFTVGVPTRASTCEAPEHIPEHEDCYTTLAFILPLVMMAVLLLLALIMIYVFFTKLSHARNGGIHGETNIAYKS